MTAAYRLKGFGWFGASTAIVLGFYLVSLQVASERKKLEHLDADITSTQRDIRALETEFDTRANLAQLERWNGDTLALSAPQPAQFLRDGAELANADVVRGPAVGPAVRTAALIVPSFVTPAQTVSATPAPVAAAAVARVVARPVSGTIQVAQNNAAPAPRPVRAALARIAAKLPRFALTRASLDAEAERPALRPAAAMAAVVRARPQMALLDRKLLSDTTLRDLTGGARAEGGRLR
ncbi:hypothetical protein [uncultured Sphingomonas sp.]|uniref:hypothetical protein n=1 Tax=uncultured Sphingomonas sp. TaxID=158754 RepID=UPI0035CA7852